MQKTNFWNISKQTVYRFIYTKFDIKLDQSAIKLLRHNLQYNLVSVFRQRRCQKNDLLTKMCLHDVIFFILIPNNQSYDLERSKCQYKK